MSGSAAPTGERDAKAAIAAIWTRSRDTALARVAVLEDAVAALIEDRLSAELRQEAEREAHRLAGSVGSFGFSAASESARQLEATFAGTAPVTPDRLPVAADEVVALRVELEGGPPVSAIPDLADTAPGEGHARQLLVAVSEPAHRDDVVAAAAARGFQAIAVTDPDEAHSVATASVAAVVDLGLSDQAGFRLLAEIAAADGSPPTLALIPTDAFTDRVEAARAGARSFLTADAPPDAVLEALDGLLERTRMAGTTVLAVDDDRSVLDGLEAVLTGAGLRMVGIDDPQQFWAALQQHAPDLVIVDLDMPQIAGDELCRVVRSDPHWAGLPIVCLTGHRVPETISAAFAAGADDFVAKPFEGPELLARISNRLERTRLLTAVADTDPLTGLANRRRGEADLQRLIGLAARHHQPLTIAMLDLDRFKQVNDHHGHAVGDAVLRRVGALLAGSFRGEDVVARWGGEEILVGMYGMAREDAVRRIGSILATVREERHPTPSGQDVSVTFSAGVATYPDDATTGHSLCEAADQALYRAKRHGRDRLLPASTNASEQDADVVIVEDDEVLVELLTHALTTRGYRVRHLVDGHEAADQLGGSPPALRGRVVLLDVDLPVLNGLGVLRRMAAAGALTDTRAIMLTARSSEPEVLEALELGAFDHVAKPFSVPVLMQRIRRALGS